MCNSNVKRDSSTSKQSLGFFNGDSFHHVWTASEVLLHRAIGMRFSSFPTLLTLTSEAWTIQQSGTLAALSFPHDRAWEAIWWVEQTGTKIPFDFTSSTFRFTRLRVWTALRKGVWWSSDVEPEKQQWAAASISRARSGPAFDLKDPIQESLHSRLPAMVLDRMQDRNSWFRIEAGNKAQHLKKSVEQLCTFWLNSEFSHNSRSSSAELFLQQEA